MTAAHAVNIQKANDMNITLTHIHLEGTESVSAVFLGRHRDAYIALKIDDSRIFITDRQQAMAIASAIEAAAMQWPAGGPAGDAEAMKSA